MQATTGDLPDGAERVLYVRRLPLFWRGLAFVLGTLFVAFASWVLLLSLTRDFSLWLCLWCLGFGFFGLLPLEAATSRGEIRWDPVSRELVFVSLWLGRVTRLERFSTLDIAAIRVRYLTMLMGGKRQLRFVTTFGEDRFVCDLAPYEAQAVSRMIAELLKVDIREG